MARHPLIGYLVWVVLFGAVFAWEGLALARVTAAFPRSATSSA
jgi:ABC-type molybdate transport system permease subunit